MLACASLLVLGACGNGKKTVNFDSAKATTTVPPTTVASSGSQATVLATTTTAGGKAAAAPKATTTTAKGAAAQAAPAPAARIGAPPGRYIYDVTGSQTGGTPPTTANTSTKQTLTIDPPSGSLQHSAVTSQGGSSPQTEETFSYGSAQILFVDLKVNQLGKEFTPSPPVLASPVPAQVGQKWSWDMTSTDKSTTVHGDFAYTGTDTVTIGGQAIPVFVLSANLTFHVTYNGAPVTVTDNQTEWVSPQSDLQVKLHTVLNAGAFGQSDTTAIMESTTPS